MLKPDAREYLVLGGGAYTIPRTLLHKYPDLHVDVVELEPELLKLAYTYFDLPVSEQMTSHIIDGRVFLNQTTKQYDVIFIDLFSTNQTIPYHLATKEFFAAIEARLTDDGVVIMNTVSTPKTIRPSLFGSIAKTMRSVFPNITAFALNDQLDVRQNAMLIARKGDVPLYPTFPDYGTTTPNVHRNPLNWSDFDFTHEITITDDRAPIEQLH